MTNIPEARLKVKEILESYFSEELGEGAADDVSEEILKKTIPIIREEERKRIIVEIKDYLFELRTIHYSQLMAFIEHLERKPNQQGKDPSQEGGE